LIFYSICVVKKLKQIMTNYILYARINFFKKKPINDHGWHKYDDDDYNSFKVHYEVQDSDNPFPNGHLKFEDIGNGRFWILLGDGYFSNNEYTCNPDPYIREKITYCCKNVPESWRCEYVLERESSKDQTSSFSSTSVTYGMYDTHYIKNFNNNKYITMDYNGKVFERDKNCKEIGNEYYVLAEKMKEYEETESQFISSNDGII